MAPNPPLAKDKEKQDTAPKLRGRPCIPKPTVRREHTLIDGQLGDGTTHCSTCGKSSRTSKGRRALLGTECAGTRAQRLLVDAPPLLDQANHLHNIVDRGGLAFCSTCGAYSFGRAVGLLQCLCQGYPSSESGKDKARRMRLERLIDNKHPVTRKQLHWSTAPTRVSGCSNMAISSRD